jgi:C4-dicarboxylate transporter
MKKLVAYLTVAILVIALTAPGGLDLQIHVTGERILESVGIGAVLAIAVMAAWWSRKKDDD